MTISFYTHTTDKKFSVVSSESIMQAIVNGEWEPQIEYLRSLGKNEYKQEKKNLGAVTWCGTFKPNTRSVATIHTYSGMICLDVDDIEQSALLLVKQQLKENPCVHFCFVSPSGTGLKIIVKVNVDYNNHTAAFLHLKDYFEKVYPIKIDPSGKDVSRLCYVSYDPTAFINQNSEVFEVDLKFGETPELLRENVHGDSEVTTDAMKIFKVCIKWIERNKIYRQGEKNVFIHGLACALNRCGVKQSEAVNMINQNFATPDMKWVQSVKSAYFHGQSEHNTVKVRDIGSSEFVAPPYVANYTDDYALNDLMTTANELYYCNVPLPSVERIVTKLAAYYETEGYVDARRKSAPELVAESIKILQDNVVNQAAKNSMPYLTTEDMAMAILNNETNSDAITTGFGIFDNEMFGGMRLGNFYAIVGMGGTYKSIIAQRACLTNAMIGVPSLFLNSEMSSFQFYERLIQMVFGVDLGEMLRSKQLSKETVESFVNQVKEYTKNNIFVVNGGGATPTSILATITHIKETTGKEIKLLVSDGLSQWEWGNLDEINAVIKNSFAAKEVAKQANVAHLALIHISGDCKKHYRDTGRYIRGSHKVLSNLDAYFSTSLLIDPLTNELINEDDIRYIRHKFYLRYTDKRAKTGMLNAVVNIGQKLALDIEDVDPNMYEISVKKPRNFQQA